MYSKTMKFEDWDGNEREQTFYFHIDEAEIYNKQAGTEGGWSEFATKLLENQDYASIVKEYEWFVTFSYGVKSDDGLLFEKSDEIARKFRGHPAYGPLFDEIISNADEMAAFFNGVFPRGMTQKLTELEAKAGKKMSEMTPEEIRAFMEEADKGTKDQDKPVGPPTKTVDTTPTGE